MVQLYYINQIDYHYLKEINKNKKNINSYGNRNKKINLVAIKPGFIPDNLYKGKNVLIIDVSISENIIKSIIDLSSSFIIIDDHVKTLNPKLPGDPHASVQSPSAQSMIQQSVTEARRALYDDAKKGVLKPGWYHVSAPTGAGKTLAALRLAAQSCSNAGFRRFICAIPYTSITQQTASITGRLLAKRDCRCSNIIPMPMNVWIVWLRIGTLMSS